MPIFLKTSYNKYVLGITQLTCLLFGYTGSVFWSVLDTHHVHSSSKCFGENTLMAFNLLLFFYIKLSKLMGRKSVFISKTKVSGHYYSSGKNTSF